MKSEGRCHRQAVFCGVLVVEVGNCLLVFRYPLVFFSVKFSTLCCDEASTQRVDKALESALSTLHARSWDEQGNRSTL